MKVQGKFSLDSKSWELGDCSSLVPDNHALHVYISESFDALLESFLEDSGTIEIDKNDLSLRISFGGKINSPLIVMSLDDLFSGWLDNEVRFSHERYKKLSKKLLQLANRIEEVGSIALKQEQE